LDSPVEAAARELAGRYGRAVRTVFAREDVVRIGPKRPPFSASAVLVGDRLGIRGRSIGPLPDSYRGPRGFELDVGWEAVAPSAARLRSSPSLRASGLAELTLLVQGALAEAGRMTSEPLGDALHDHVVHVPSGAAAAVRVAIDGSTGAIDHVGVTVAAGDPLDEVVLRSYAIGAAHMALGWVLTEGLAVDPETGEVHDLTIRSFGIVKPKDVPPIDVSIVDASGPPQAASSDAVFAAVAAATWNALARAEGERPEMFPALGTRASRMLRR
jgi:CO/xanthine dehydrogenase Mo-binding subunit